MRTDKPAPLQLQLNNSGSWKTVVRFVSSTRTLDRVKRAAEMLGGVDGERMQWRIATTDSLPVTLLHWAPGQGWKVS